MDAPIQGALCVASVRRLRRSEDTRKYCNLRGLRMSAETTKSLLTHIEEHRRELIGSALKASSFGHWSGTVASSLFTNTFLDKLTLEIYTGGRESLEAWCDAASDTGAASECPRLVVLTCAALSASFAGEHGLSEEVFSYLTERGNELAQRIEKADAARKHGVQVDPSTLVDREDVVTSLLVTLEARDPETAEHAKAVGAWCRRIARAMHLATEQQEFAALCGTLHDVGKVSTPREIINKPGPLNEDEWADMHAHSRVGAKLLERIPSLKGVAPAVRSHHERWDGKGYPRSPSRRRDSADGAHRGGRRRVPCDGEPAQLPRSAVAQPSSGRTGRRPRDAMGPNRDRRRPWHCRAGAARDRAAPGS